MRADDRIRFYAEMTAHAVWYGVGMTAVIVAGARGGTGFGPVVWMAVVQVVGVVLVHPQEKRSLRARIAGWTLVATGTAIGIRYLVMGQ